MGRDDDDVADRPDALEREHQVPHVVLVVQPRVDLVARLDQDRDQVARLLVRRDVAQDAQIGALVAHHRLAPQLALKDLHVHPLPVY